MTQQSDTTCPKTTELKVVEGEKKNAKDFKAMLLLRQHTKVRDQQILAQTDIPTHLLPSRREEFDV